MTNELLDWLWEIDFPELNRLMVFAERLGGAIGTVSQQLLLQECRQGPIRGAGHQNHQATVAGARSLGLLEESQGDIRFSERGWGFLWANPKREYNLSPLQRLIVFDALYNDLSCGEIMRVLISQFVYDPTLGCFVFSEKRGALDSTLQTALMVLQKLSLVDHKRDVWHLAQELSPIGRLVKHKTRAISPQELAARFDRQTERGEAAEETALEFEKERLTTAGDRLRADLVVMVCRTDVTAGFDIASFSSESVSHDRLIEVKAINRDTLRFYWTRNEVVTAFAERGNYWLYLVELFSEGANIVAIQDPVAYIKGDPLAENAWGLGLSRTTEWQVEIGSLYRQTVCLDDWDVLGRFRFLNLTTYWAETARVSPCIDQ